MPDREKLSYVIGSDTIVNAMPYLPARVPFDDLVLDFLQALSEQLLRDTARYPDVATFAFWCRRAALEKEKAAYGNRGIRLGRGVIFIARLPTCQSTLPSALLLVYLLETPILFVFQPRHFPR